MYLTSLGNAISQL